MSALSIGKEQHALPIYDEKKLRVAPHAGWGAAKLGLVLLLSSLLVWLSTKHIGGHLEVSPLTGRFKAGEVCPQQDPLTPSKHADLIRELDVLYSTGEFKEWAVELLSGAVKIPTVNFDDMGLVGEDSRWDVFHDFHSYLHFKFPLIHSSFPPTKVNTYGLIYHVEGSDPSLKPILLMAHQDVVPVNNETLSEWEYPPFSGHFDGHDIWGRGAVDDKGPLISILTALETLLSKDFKPARSIFFVSGFDEETSGHQGASYISQFLLETYGEDHFAFIVDEGVGHSTQYGARFALPGVGEKGYMDVSITVESPGGHSSVPPAHTSIGMLASALVQLERHPHRPSLTRTTPYYFTLLCQAEHAPDMPTILQESLLQSITSDRALRRSLALVLADDDTRIVRSSLSTTQAINIVSGGVKVNALPEQAQAFVNHRIHTDSTTQEVADRLVLYLRPIAKKHNLTFDAFNATDQQEATSSAGTFRLGGPLHNWLEPAPLTPTYDAPWALLAGTIRQTWNTGQGADTNETIFVAPSLMVANTDTRHFWKLTKHIYRYNHLGLEDARGIHTINEVISSAGFVEHIRFFTYLVLNADEATL